MIKELKPLGVFGPRSGQPFNLPPDQLRKLTGCLDNETRQLVVNYLLGGTLIIPLMEYTTDVLDGAFGVSGGSGIMSDGVYYWRRDAIDYVLHYGIDIGSEALEHMRSQGWTAPKLNDTMILEIDTYLHDSLRRP
jgi:hypothetical protein